MHGSKRLLIVSHGPVPTPEHGHVEGGGLRCWGLARGIQSNATDLDITIGYHDYYRKPGYTTEHEGIRLATWDHETIGSLARDFDSVLISYCMGEHAVRLVRALRREQQLVLDCYVPIFTEVSAQTAPTRSASRPNTSARSGSGRSRSRGAISSCAPTAPRSVTIGACSRRWDGSIH